MLACGQAESLSIMSMPIPFLSSSQGGLGGSLLSLIRIAVGIAADTSPSSQKDPGALQASLLLPVLTLLLADDLAVVILSAGPAPSPVPQSPPRWFGWLDHACSG